MIKCIVIFQPYTTQLIGSITFAMGKIVACKMLHEGMLEMMMSHPMSFFDTTSIGRIANTHQLADSMIWVLKHSY